jgi:hypothetical protein
MADEKKETVKVKSKAKARKSKKVNKKDAGWSMWDIVAISAAAIAATAGLAYYLLAGEEAPATQKTRKASDAI